MGGRFAASPCDNHGVKVLHVNSLYAPHEWGGAERSVRSLAEVSRQHGVTTAVVTIGRFHHVDNLHGVTKYEVPLPWRYWPFGDKGPRKVAFKVLDLHNVWTAAHFDRILGEWSPDVVHTHNLSGFSTLVWAKARARAIPVVHTLRDYNLVCGQGTMFRAGRSCTASSRCTGCRLYSTPKILATKDVQAVVGISSTVLRLHREAGAFPDTPASVIPNGFACNSTAERKLHTRPLTLGYLGRLTIEKGVFAMLDWFAAQTDDTRLRIAGTGDHGMLDRLRARFNDPKITFVGQVEPSSFLDTVDAVVVPSLWEEPFGRVVIEALCHGRPVLGARRGGILDLIQHGRTGYLFDPSSPDGFDGALAWLRSQDLAALADPCRRAAQSFGIDHVVRRYGALYERVVAEGGPNGSSSS